MTPTPEQLAKLPKWAREHLSYMEMRLREAKLAAHEMSGSVPNAMVWADSYGEFPRPLEVMGRPVRFTTEKDISDWDHYIDVTLEAPGAIRVRGGRSLTVHPESTNGLVIRINRNY